MTGDPIAHITPPGEFLGRFGDYIEQVRQDLEVFFEGDTGRFDSVSERAEAGASFFAAQSWLVDKWGDHLPCPACKNVEWTVSEVAPTALPEDNLGFYVVCRYCTNTMQVIPDYAELETPHLTGQELDQPDQE